MTKEKSKAWSDMKNTGYNNTGDRNSGNLNSGSWNSGSWNSGHWNSGDRNSGDRNPGHWNSGYWNSGHRNSGYWNSGNWNSGYFNTDTPDTIRCFGKEAKMKDWNNAEKPNFLFFELTERVGGELKTYGYQEAFRKSWNEAEDKEAQYKLLKALPNYDEDVFEQIAGFRPGDLLGQSLSGKKDEESCECSADGTTKCPEHRIP